MAPMGGSGSNGKQHTVALMRGNPRGPYRGNGSYGRQLTVAPIRGVVAPIGGSTQWLLWEAAHVASWFISLRKSPDVGSAKRNMAAPSTVSKRSQQLKCLGKQLFCTLSGSA